MSYSNGLGNLQNLLGTVATNSSARSEASTAAGTAATTGTTAQRGTDQTQFSSVSGLLGQALSGSDTRMPKVLALSAAIAAGTYSVSSSDVAGKMIDAMLG